MSGTQSAICPLCPHACALREGQIGYCNARIGQNGEVKPLCYGAYSSLSLDPIEKKPFYHFYPGSKILSIGGYGCNMRCYFCQNSELSQTRPPHNAHRIMPAELAQEALRLQKANNIGLAYTYNEPVVAYEFIIHTARLIRQAGLKNALVTNGCFCEGVFKELLPDIDACNIDLKCFHKEGYQKLGGDFQTVQNAIASAIENTHVEITTLVVPGLSDEEADMEKEARWLSRLSPELPLHISRYFPRYKSGAPATEPEKLQRLYEIAKQYLNNVYLGNC